MGSNRAAEEPGRAEPPATPPGSVGPLAEYRRTLFANAASRNVLPGDEQLPFILKHIPADRGAHLLDAGCGNGRYAFTLARTGYRNITAVDLFEALDTRGAFRYRRGSVAALDLPDASVDFVYCMSVIYHLADPCAGLAELRRVLKPGGRVVLSAHTKYSLFTLERAVGRTFGQARHLRGVRFRSAREYGRMLQRLGFEVLDVDGYRLIWTPRLVRWLRARLRSDRARPARERPAGAAPAAREESPRWLKRLRSVIGYHSLIAARKPADG